MTTVEEIKNALIESNRVAHMPIPQFHGKKIENEEQKCNKFRDICCGEAHTWLSTLTDYPQDFLPRQSS